MESGGFQYGLRQKQFLEWRGFLSAFTARGSFTCQVVVDTPSVLIKVSIALRRSSGILVCWRFLETVECLRQPQLSVCVSPPITGAWGDITLLGICHGHRRGRGNSARAVCTRR